MDKTAQKEQTLKNENIGFSCFFAEFEYGKTKENINFGIGIFQM